MSEETKFQEMWGKATETLFYLMFGWLCELNPPEWRLILLPLAIVTSILLVVPTIIFASLDVLINGEFYD